MRVKACNSRAAARGSRNCSLWSWSAWSLHPAPDSGPVRQCRFNWFLIGFFQKCCFANFHVDESLPPPPPGSVTCRSCLALRSLKALYIVFHRPARFCYLSPESHVSQSVWNFSDNVSPSNGSSPSLSSEFEPALLQPGLRTLNSHHHGNAPRVDQSQSDLSQTRPHSTKRRAL